MKRNFVANLKYDLPAGLVVFLVALPLCLGVALASGAPLLAGLIAGIVGGIVIGSLSGSSLSVSGPAAGLTAIVLLAIHQLGSFPVFLTAVVIAGVIQLLLGLAKAGTVAGYFPGNVIKGMLSAIGIIIIMNQVPHALGYDKNADGDLAFIQVDENHPIASLIEPLKHIDAGATVVALISLGIIVLWEQKFMRKLAVVPGALVAVLAGLIINEVWRAGGMQLAIGQEHLVKIPVFNDFNAIKSAFVFPDFSAITNKAVIVTAFTIAAVASIETLLCVEAVDKLDPNKRTTSANRELKAQGIGNIISGLIGGLPITSVIVRSSANVNAGARSKASTIFHGILLLVCTLAIPALLNKVPLAALAAVLIATGYKLAKPTIFIEMFRKGKYQWVPFIVTVVAIVLTDLLKGVGIGMAVSALAILWGNLRAPYFFHKEKHHDGELIHIELAQEVSFLNKVNIKNTLTHLPEKSMVWIDASRTSYIDHDVLELIKEFKDVQAPDKDIELYTTGFKEVYQIENNEHVISEEVKDMLVELKNKAKQSSGTLSAPLAG